MGSDPLPRREHVGTGDAPRGLRIDLEYDGTDLLGWQRQAGGRTVQAVVEAALERVLGAPHRVVGAGRTDAGVHARHMVASCRTPSALPAARIARALDAVLPPDVGVRSVSDASPSFHARRDARWKWYRYVLLTTRGRRPLERRVTWRVPVPLDPDTLDAAASALVGTHDYRSFASAGSPRRSTVRTLWVVSWTRDEEHLRLDVVGDGFLYKMIRTLVGTMVAAARGGGGPAAARAAMAGILAARDRAAAGPTAPARGLTLMAVGVAGEDAVGRLPPRFGAAVESALSGPSGGPP